jgi:hypothetical protein
LLFFPFCVVQVPDVHTGRAMRGLFEAAGLREARCGVAMCSSDDFGWDLFRELLTSKQ